MRNPIFSFVFAGAFLVAGSALALNPQPLPPGKAVNHAYEPPDPCMQAQSHGSGGGAGKIHMRKAGGEQMMMRKAGGEQMHSQSNVHCLNPQPLPPG